MPDDDSGVPWITDRLMPCGLAASIEALVKGHAMVIVHTSPIKGRAMRPNDMLSSPVLPDSIVVTISPDRFIAKGQTCPGSGPAAKRTLDGTRCSRNAATVGFGPWSATRRPVGLRRDRKMWTPTFSVVVRLPLGKLSILGGCYAHQGAAWHRGRWSTIRWHLLIYELLRPVSARSESP